MSLWQFKTNKGSDSHILQKFYLTIFFANLSL